MFGLTKPIKPPPQVPPPHLPAPSLWDAVAAGLQNAEGALVAHAHKTAKRQLEHHALLERHKVAYVLEEEIARAVVVTVAEVAGNQRVLATSRQKW